MLRLGVISLSLVLLGASSLPAAGQGLPASAHVAELRAPHAPEAPSAPAGPERPEAPLAFAVALLRSQLWPASQVLVRPRHEPALGPADAHSRRLDRPPMAWSFR